MRKVLPDTTSLSKEARPHYPNIETLDIGTQPPQSSQTSAQTEQHLNDQLLVHRRNGQRRMPKFLPLNVRVQ